MVEENRFGWPLASVCLFGWAVATTYTNHAPLIPVFMERLELGRTTPRGKRWNQTRVAYTRKQYGIAAVDKTKLDPNILSLGQAVTSTGGSDTTLMKVIKQDTLPCHQVAPYAPPEINKTDLDTDLVRSILNHLKETGVLVLEGVSLTRQQSLFR